MTSCRFFLLAAVFLAIFGMVADQAFAAEPSNATMQPLLDAVTVARDRFRPVGEDDVRRALDQLSNATARLENRLALDGSNGQAWREFLKVDELNEQLRQNQPSLDALETIYRRFNSGAFGSNRRCFSDVREALLRTIQVTRATGTAELDKAYRKYIDALAVYLRTYVQNPNAEMAARIGEALDWLDSIGQAPDLLDTVRDQLARPNLFVTVSKRLVAAGIEEPVDETVPVRDVILGTDLYGTGHNVGEITLALVPNQDHAVFDLTYRGITSTRNTGYNGPVVIFSKGTTGIGATKRLWLNAAGLASHPARARATTHSNILDIQPQRGGRMVERIAWRKASEQKCLAESIASQHAATRAERQMDSRAGVVLDDVNSNFEDKFREPAAERNLFPSELQFRTDEDALHVLWRQASASQLAAPTEPPAANAEADLTVRIHESMANNAAQTALAGLTLNEDEFRMAAKELLDRVPEPLKPIPGEEPWGVSFDRTQPIEVQFADDGFRLTLHGRRYFQSDKAHPGMDVSASYKIVRDDSGFRAVRQGDVEVVPPGLGKDERVGTRYQIIRTLLIRRFDRIFEKEVRFEDIELPGKWGANGPLSLVQLRASDGWLTIAWKARK